ncbi:glyoxylase-like metal-dependent hydrolase (beta-lactamase superfamily II) [Microbacterium sp. W4I4]|uniref:MBL fold metallo-hydrolase n=1 Tax=Microbacterium sp. W4I4 TaxID=3042295 RepID=UPI00278A84D8|nr:MBL fold metallo-hydrolase [Microbacterium sp. W4I4]MDQ0614829.1 glyoxylase-like metal-dependent hydrolase (beta-lactamase superfamily II) [Microbacterium sp. W4I4]
MNEITVGDVTITRVEEMHGPILPPEQFFPSIPAAAWQEHRAGLSPDHLDDAGEMVQVAMQPWLVRSGGKTILIDTGVGSHKSRPAVDAWDHLDLDFVAALARAGAAPEDIDIVVNTHLHVDHVGWNTTWREGQWVPTFPNAVYLMPEEDFVYWNPETNPRVAGGVNENVYEDSVMPVHQAGQVQLWTGSHRIDDALELQAAPGHTPGSSIVRMDSGGRTVIFAGDLLHSPIQVFEPGHNSCFCEDPEQALATRHAVLTMAAETGALVLPAHISGHSGFEVEAAGDAFTITRWAEFSKL